MYFSYPLSKSAIPFLVLVSALCTLSLKSDTVPSLGPNLLKTGNDFDLKPNFDEEYKLFLEELDNGTAKAGVKSRQKRYVYLNTETNLDVGYLIVIPITVVLPPMTNLFNTWRRKRSLDNFAANTTSEEQSPVLQQQVDRITSYYDLINVNCVQYDFNMSVCIDAIYHCNYLNNNDYCFRFPRRHASYVLHVNYLQSQTISFLFLTSFSVNLEIH